ncbi:MAG: hypothetical protein K6D94_13420 [Clostridiales bacterium]|nr:hypothetical protein [Clostridiales bacterium]
MKLFISVLLAAAVILSAVACGADSGSVSPADTAAAKADGVTEVQEAEETGEERLMPDIPDKNYDGQDLRFLSREVTDTVVRFYSEVASDELDGEIMNDTVYERTRRIEEKYGVVIVNDVSSDVSGTYKKTYQAGEQNWDVLIDGFSAVLGVANSGFTADLTQIPYIDLDKPWWDTRVAEAMKIKGHVYSAVGAMNTWTDSHSYAVVFNKVLANDFGIEPYQLVRDGKWTLDTFQGLLDQVTADINGDGVLDENDRYGTMGETFNFRLHVLASDVTLITQDDEGSPKLNITERLYQAADKVCRMMCGDSYVMAEYLKLDDVWTGMRNIFRAGNSLFYTGGIEQMLIFRDLETDIGLLPFPKLDEAQDRYAHSFSTYWSSTIFIPRNTTTEEFTGHLLEAIQADSFYSTSVAYHDVVLKGKAMRDTDSVDMLQIIRQSRTIDPEFAYNFIDIGNVYNSLISKKSSDSLASQLEKKQSSAEGKIEKLISKIEG